MTWAMHWQRTKRGAVSRLCVALLLVEFAVASGCASSAYHELVSENDVPALVELREVSERHPVQMTMAPTLARESSAIVDIAIYETGQADAERAIVLIHGILADHSAWRFVQGALAEDFRVILIDLPGAGASDKPSAAALGEGGYSPSSIAERVLHALRMYFDVTDWPEAITVAAHSFGGAVTLQMAGNELLRAEYDDVIRRFDGLALFTPADVEIPIPPPIFYEVATASDLKFWLGVQLGILRNRIADGVADMFCHPAPGLREEVDKLVTMLSDPATQHAQQAMLRQFIPLTDERRIDWPRTKSLTAAYGNIAIPTVIVWGALDETLPVSMGHKLAAEIPGAELRIVDSCMHSTPLERPRLVIDIIREMSAERSADDH